MIPTDAASSLKAPLDSREAILRLLDRPLDAADVREATQRVALPLAPPDRHLTSLLAFRVGEELLALPVEDIVRVTRGAAVHRIPHRSSAVVRGLCNIEGDLLLCVDLPALLGMPERPAAGAPAPRETDDAQRMVVLGQQAETWAIQVDEVLGVVPVEASALLPPPVTVQRARQNFTRNLAPLQDGRLAALLDSRRLVAGFQAALS